VWEEECNEKSGRSETKDTRFQFVCCDYREINSCLLVLFTVFIALCESQLAAPFTFSLVFVFVFVFRAPVEPNAIPASLFLFPDFPISPTFCRKISCEQCDRRFLGHLYRFLAFFIYSKRLLCNVMLTNRVCGCWSMRLLTADFYSMVSLPLFSRQI